jgi:Holliday junction resolvase RusA-like endonuclease
VGRLQTNKNGGKAMNLTIKTPYPISTNRYYRKFKNIMMISKEGLAFKQIVKYENLKMKPVSRDVKLEILIHPKQKKDGCAYNKVIDIDNGLKCILDSLIGVVYNDDKQVKDLHVKYGASAINGGATVNVSNYLQIERIFQPPEIIIGGVNLSPYILQMDTDQQETKIIFDLKYLSEIELANVLINIEDYRYDRSDVKCYKFSNMKSILEINYCKRIEVNV